MDKAWVIILSRRKQNENPEELMELVCADCSMKRRFKGNWFCAWIRQGEADNPKAYVIKDLYTRLPDCNAVKITFNNVRLSAPPEPKQEKIDVAVEKP